MISLSFLTVLQPVPREGVDLDHRQQTVAPVVVVVVAPEVAPPQGQGVPAPVAHHLVRVKREAPKSQRRQKRKHQNHQKEEREVQHQDQQRSMWAR